MGNQPNCNGRNEHYNENDLIRSRAPQPQNNQRMPPPQQQQNHQPNNANQKNNNLKARLNQVLAENDQDLEQQNEVLEIFENPKEFKS